MGASESRSVLCIQMFWKPAHQSPSHRKNKKGEDVCFVVHNRKRKFYDILGMVLEVYGPRPAIELSLLTHSADGPWEKHLIKAR